MTSCWVSCAHCQSSGNTSRVNTRCTGLNQFPCSALPESAMKVAPLAVAAALTKVVLLQPGGPWSNTPLGQGLQKPGT